MSTYTITYESGFDINGIPSVIAAEVTAAFYSTQATSGAGMVADFYAHLNDTRPCFTFAKVHAVQFKSTGGSGGTGNTPWTKWPAEET